MNLDIPSIETHKREDHKRMRGGCIAIKDGLKKTKRTIA